LLGLGEFSSVHVVRMDSWSCLGSDL